MLPGYIRKNGVPYSGNAVLTEFYNRLTGADGQIYLSMTATVDDLTYLKGLVESGKLRPVIDRTYPLSEAREAVRYVGTGQARGKVVITA